MYDYYRTPFLHQLATCPIPQVPSPQHLPSPSPQHVPSPHLVMSPSPQLSGYNLMNTVVQDHSSMLQDNQLNTSAASASCTVSKADLCDQRDKAGPSTTPSLVDPSLDDSTAIDWSLISTRSLISLYEANKERFVGSNKKRNKVWLDITNELNEMGFNFTDKQVKNRWHYLMNRYKKMIDDNNRSGSGRKTWELYDDMDAILGDKPNIKPTGIQETDLSDDNDDKRDDSTLGDEKEKQAEDIKSRKRKYKSSADKLDSIFQQFMQEKRKADDEREKKRQAREQEKEEQRERRHNEKQELLKAFLEILSKK